MAQSGTAWHCLIQHGMALLDARGMAQQDMAWHHAVWHSMVWHGMVEKRLGQHGVAPNGMA